MPERDREEAALLLWGVMHGLGHELRRRLEPVLRAHGLSSPLQVALLAVLQKRGPQRLVDLGRLIPFPVSTLSESADRLVTAGLATRRANPGDRRSVLLEVTPRGTDVLRHLQAETAKRIEGLLAGLDDAALGALLTGLRPLAAQLGGEAQDPRSWCGPWAAHGGADG